MIVEGTEVGSDRFSIISSYYVGYFGMTQRDPLNPNREVHIIGESSEGVD